MRFGHQKPGPAEIGHLAPQGAGKPVRVSAVTQLAQHEHRGFVGEKFQRAIADELRFGVED